MWAYEGIFYQIYPIGFCGAPTANDGKTVSRILKLKDWSSYLESLGISSILLLSVDGAAKTTVEDNTVNANTVALPQSTVFILAFM